jgi:hypothetical protein
LIELDPVWPRRIGLWETQALPLAFEAGRSAALAALPQIERTLRARVARHAA